MREHYEDRYKGFTKEMTEDIQMPSSLNVELNSTCNYQCIFCPYHSKHSSLEHSSSVMSVRMAKAILSEAYKLGIGRKEVGLYISGEPFLHPHLIEIIRFAKSLGFGYVYLTTNGALAFPDKIYDAIEAGLDSIRFSVNAAERETYLVMHGRDEFEKVKNGIISLCRYREKNKIDISISISCVITKQTQNITEMMKDLFGKYVDDIIFFPVIRNDCFRDSTDDIFFKEQNQSADDEFICKALFDSMYINANAEVLVCCDSCAMGKYVVAKYGEASLSDIWNMPLYRKYRSLYTEHQSLEGTICENCNTRLTSGRPFFVLDDNN